MEMSSSMASGRIVSSCHNWAALLPVLPGAGESNCAGRLKVVQAFRPCGMVVEYSGCAFDDG